MTINFISDTIKWETTEFERIPNIGEKVILDDIKYKVEDVETVTYMSGINDINIYLKKV